MNKRLGPSNTARSLAIKAIRQDGGSVLTKHARALAAANGLHGSDADALVRAIETACAAALANRGPAPTLAAAITLEMGKLGYNI